MQFRIREIVPLVWLCAFSAAVLVGCATTPADLSKKCNVTIEILPSEDKNVDIKEANACQDGKELIITGTVIKNGATYRTYGGVIEISVISPDGETLAVGTVEYRHHVSRWRDTSFEKRFSINAEPGTKVRLVFHSLDETGLKTIRRP